MLSDTEKNAFREQGYVLVPGAFDRGEVSEIAAAFDRLEGLAAALQDTATLRGSLFVMGRAHPEAPPRIDRIVWCGGAEPVLQTVGRSAKVVEAAADLLGRASVDHLINQAHIKRPGDGLAFRWHQDSHHRRYGTDLWNDVDRAGSFVQLILAVDAMTPENGALAVVPGTHRRGHLSVDAAGALPPNAFDEGEAILLDATPGDLVALHPFTVHGSGPNRGASKRRVFINGFAVPGANRRVYPGAGIGVRLTVARRSAA